MATASGSPDQGTLPFIGLDDEPSALRDEISRLRAENNRLLRLLELTPQQARQPGPVQRRLRWHAGSGARRLAGLGEGGEAADPPGGRRGAHAMGAGSHPTSQAPRIQPRLTAPNPAARLAPTYTAA